MCYQGIGVIDENKEDIDKMERIVDARGMDCPLPVVNAKKAAEEMQTGDILTILVDNEIAVQNLQKYQLCNAGYSLRSSDKRRVISRPSERRV